jgi:hypothetical protein
VPIVFDGKTYMLFSGRRADYQWLVSGPEIRDLTELLVRFHLGLRLCVTSFDSGPLRLAREELEQGWRMVRHLAISPPINESLVIPQDGFDEWYIFESSPVIESDLEVFVNYGAFTLASPETLNESECNAEKAYLDWLPQAQERFWVQVQQLQPMTFVASGDYDIVVSRANLFFETVRAASVPSC